MNLNSELNFINFMQSSESNGQCKKCEEAQQFVRKQ